MIRLDRYLVTLGKGSRSQLQKEIRSGAVSVNGSVVKDPGFSCAEGCAITLRGEALDTRLTRHVLLHKPAGLLTAARDKKQPTVMDLLPDEYAAIGCMPVGRLDKDTTGVLFLTTDGELNHRLLSPGRHVDKTYLAEVDGPLTQADVDAFADGLTLSDFTAAPAHLVIQESGEERSVGRVTVHEGKFHQIKRMFESRGRTVTKLHRQSFGPLDLADGLPVGKWRELTDAEAKALYSAASMLKEMEEQA